MKKIVTIMLYGFVFLLVSCSNENVNLYNESHLNKAEESVEKQAMFKYLSEEDYGADYRTIVYLHEQLLEFIEDETLLEKYNENYFNKNDLVIFNFNTQHSEGKINVAQARRVNHDIFIDINIQSPANKENIFFDAQIQGVRLTIEIPKYLDDLYYEKDRVMILVINTNFENTYRSIYYNCEKQ